MRTAWLPAAGLLLLAPVCAEYLWGYDDTTGDAVELLGGLLFFGPLYGAPALLIRETARRRGLGWPGILLLAAAFGVVEAGIVDQSMFSRNYRDIPYWQDMSAPTYVEPIQLSVYLVLLFVGGHVVLSICSPIAVMESLSHRRDAPWLSRTAIVVVTLLYLAASALVLADTMATETDHASTGQLVGAIVAVLALVAAAFATGRRAARVGPAPGGVPGPWVVAGGAGTAWLAGTLLPPSVPGTVAVALVAALTAGTVLGLSRRAGWGREHVLALAAGALVASGVAAFWTVPLGDVPAVPKYAHNAVLLVLVTGLALLAARRVRAEGTPGST